MMNNFIIFFALGVCTQIENMLYYICRDENGGVMMAKASKQDVTKIQNALTACRNLNRQVIQCRDLAVPENISLRAHGMAIIEMVELLHIAGLSDGTQKNLKCTHKFRGLRNILAHKYSDETVVEALELLPAVRKELQQVITKLIGGR